MSEVIKNVSCVVAWCGLLQGCVFTFFHYVLLLWCSSVCLSKDWPKTLSPRTNLRSINSLSFSIWRRFRHTPVSQISNPLNMFSGCFTSNKELSSRRHSLWWKHWKIINTNCSFCDIVALHFCGEREMWYCCCSYLLVQLVRARWPLQPALQYFSLRCFGSSSVISAALTNQCSVLAVWQVEGVWGTH